VDLDENLFISLDDTKNLTDGKEIRLMGLGNIRINKINHELHGEYIGDEMNVDLPKIQWIPQKNFHKLKILIPKELFFDDVFNEHSLEQIEVYSEPHYLELEEGAEIQFVRFGYCRKDSQTQAIYTHK